jgi:hypothetical protein
VCREYDLKQSALDECIELFIQDRTHRPKSRPEDEKALQEEWEPILERGATLSHQVLRHE